MRLRAYAVPLVVDSKYLLIEETVPTGGLQAGVTESLSALPVAGGSVTAIATGLDSFVPLRGSQVLTTASGTVMVLDLSGTAAPWTLGTSINKSLPVHAGAGILYSDNAGIYVVPAP